MPTGRHKSLRIWGPVDWRRDFLKKGLRPSLARRAGSAVGARVPLFGTWHSRTKWHLALWHSTLFGTWHSGTREPTGTWHSGTRPCLALGTWHSGTRDLNDSHTCSTSIRQPLVSRSGLGKYAPISILLYSVLKTPSVVLPRCKTLMAKSLQRSCWARFSEA